MNLTGLPQPATCSGAHKEWRCRPQLADRVEPTPESHGFWPQESFLAARPIESLLIGNGKHILQLLLASLLMIDALPAGLPQPATCAGAHKD
jgi:hypothetical protein